MAVIKMETLNAFAQAIQGYAHRLSLDGTVIQFDVSGDVRALAKQQSDEQPFYLTLAFLQRGTSPSTRTSCPTVTYAEPGYTSALEYVPDTLLAQRYGDLGTLLTQGPRAVAFTKTDTPLRFRVMVPERLEQKVEPVTPEQAQAYFAAMRASLQ